MTLADDALGRASEGFEGGLAGLGLSDLLQLNAQNRFSGCFRIEYEGALGVIFFRDGEIVHAERGELVGEEAFREILAWPRGRFGVEPNVVAARRTIQKSCEHLLLDALRVVDELRSGLAPPAPAQAAAPTSTGGAAAAVEAARHVPGVAEAVLVTRDGKRASEGGYEAEVVAGQAAYVAMMAAELGALFQAGELRSAAIQGERRHLLLLAGKAQSLAVFVRADHELGSVEAGIRAALVKSR
jgi:predicted regulator of Ras-like GTPase activity (Roadblock/LC7/MglB family)